jgi:hypothetical protein
MRIVLTRAQVETTTEPMSNPLRTCLSHNDATGPNPSCCNGSRLATPRLDTILDTTPTPGSTYVLAGPPYGGSWGAALGVRTLKICVKIYGPLYKRLEGPSEEP